MQSPKLYYLPDRKPSFIKVLRYGLDAIPYHVGQLWQQVLIDSCETASQLFSKIALGLGNVKIIFVDFVKYSKTWLYLVGAH